LETIFSEAKELNVALVKNIPEKYRLNLMSYLGKYERGIKTFYLLTKQVETLAPTGILYLF